VSLPSKCSLNQKDNPIKELITKHRLNLNKINEPLKEVQRLLSLGDKECERLEQEVSHPSKAENSSTRKNESDPRLGESMRISNLGNDLSNKFPNYSAAARRPPFDRYPNTFFGYCYNCYNFGHKAIECRTPMRRNCVRKDYPTARTLNETKNSFSVLSREEECSKCNNFGHTATNCRLRQFIHEEGKTDDICGISLNAQKDKAKWYIDSGCTKHMTDNNNKIFSP